MISGILVAITFMTIVFVTICYCFWVNVYGEYLGNFYSKCIAAGVVIIVLCVSGLVYIDRIEQTTTIEQEKP